ncbi:MAG TPA: type III secretion system translocon subunit SctE, partial [Parachlamydiaceae bacterium]|nr:type III secretion system translocon subunit SctE [Parachlamydiaceae bacterium]
VHEVEEILNQGLAVANAIPSMGPNGPLRHAMIDILRNISHALSAFKTSLYEGQGATSEQAQAWSKAKMDMNLNQIKENVAKAKEASSKQDKIASMGIFGKIFKFIIMLILLIISACTLNPVGCAVAVMGMIDAVEPEMEVFKKVMQGIEDLVAKLMPYLSLSQLKGVQIFAKFMFILQAGAIMILSCPDLLTSSHIVRDIAMRSGKSKEEAEAAEQSAIMIGTMVATIVVAIVGTIVTLGAGAFAIFPGLASQFPRLGAAAASLANLGSQFGGKAAQIAQATATMINDLVSLTQSGLQIGQGVIKQDLAMLLAKMKARKVESDADIANIQKLIKKLLAMLSADASAINFIASIQSHILSSAGQTSTSIASISA